LPNPFSYPEFSTKANSFTYLVTPQFKLSTNVMMYARLASGYRSGGPNITSQIYAGVPTSFKPDTTRNYEIGLKGVAFDNALSFDGSLYYIDWSDIQIAVLNPNFIGYTANAGTAKSQGLELSIESKPLSGLTIAAWGAWSDAELKDSFPPGSSSFGVAGDRLPYSSRFSGRISVDQGIPIANDVAVFLGASLSHVGDRKGVFVSTFGPPERQTLSAYTQTDVHGGVEYESWKLNFFVTNVADKRGVLNGGIGTFNPSQFGYIQPRIVGMLLSKTF
jgi:outer membrane receptor protein involved in Fe transport